jgi:hypothetical protein
MRLALAEGAIEVLLRQRVSSYPCSDACVGDWDYFYG